MCAVVYRGANDLRVETVPVPRVGPNGLLVKAAVCGVCPTDINNIQYGNLLPPQVFGHSTRAEFLVPPNGDTDFLNIFRGRCLPGAFSAGILSFKPLTISVIRRF